MCVIANERCALCPIFTSDSQSFLTKAIIVHGFIIFLRSNFVIFFWEHFSLSATPYPKYIKYAGLLSDKLES